MANPTNYAKPSIAPSGYGIEKSAADASFRLLENGDFRLLENGNKRLLESGIINSINYIAGSVTNATNYS